MALSYLVDTSVLTRLRRPEIRCGLEPLATDGQVGRLTICDLEIGFSARDEEEWIQLLRALDQLESVDTTAADHRRALEVRRLLARPNQRGRKIPDLLVAAAAERRDLRVLHYDHDFDLIAEVTGQDCRWLVPRGVIP